MGGNRIEFDTIGAYKPLGMGSMTMTTMVAISRIVRNIYGGVVRIGMFARF
jgi:hypothetical protein